MLGSNARPLQVCGRSQKTPSLFQERLAPAEQVREARPSFFTLYTSSHSYIAYSIA